MKNTLLTLALLFSTGAMANDSSQPRGLHDPGDVVLAQFDPLDDVGTELANDPYVAMRGLSQGTVEGFREVYVNPESIAKKLSPSSAVRVQPVDSVAPLAEDESGEGRTVRLTINRKKFGPKHLSGAAVEAAIKRTGAHAVSVDGDQLSIVIGPEGIASLWNVTFSYKRSVYRVSQIGALQLLKVNVVTDAKAPKGDKTASTEEWVDLMPSPSSWDEQPNHGDLHVKNQRSTWADVTINGEKIGVIGPYDEGVIKGLTPGHYTVAYRASNGFEWSTLVQTQ